MDLEKKSEEVIVKSELNESVDPKLDNIPIDKEKKLDKVDPQPLADELKKQGILATAPVENQSGSESDLESKSSDLLVFMDNKIFSDQRSIEYSNNILKLYNIDKTVDKLSKVDLVNLSSVDKANMAYSLAMVKHIFVNRSTIVNNSILEEHTKDFYRLLKNNYDDPILPCTLNLAVGDGGGTLGIDGVTANLGKRFFDYNIRDKSVNSKSILWTENKLFCDLKVSGVDKEGAKIFVSIGNKILKGNTEGQGLSSIIWENESDIVESGITINGTNISIDSTLLGYKPDIILEVVSNSLTDQDGKLISKDGVIQKDEVMIQLSTNGVFDTSRSGPRITEGEEKFILGGYVLSDVGKISLNKISDLIKTYQNRILNFDQIAMPVKISVGVDYVPPKLNADFINDKDDPNNPGKVILGRRTLEAKLEKIIEKKSLDKDMLTKILTSIEEQTSGWEPEKLADAKNKQSDLIVCRTLASIIYLLESLDGVDSKIIQKIEFDLENSIKKGLKPENSDELDESGVGVKKDRFFDFEFELKRIIINE